MAQAFANPIEAPSFYNEDGKFDFDAYDHRCEEYRAKTLDYIKTELRGTHKLAGKIIRFPVADGYASYMLWTPTKWIHLEEGDAWHADPALIRGMRAADVAARVAQDEARAALFR